MFRRRSENEQIAAPPAQVERVTTVLSTDTNWNGRLSGIGGVRIEGSFEGEIEVSGLLVIGEKGRATCKHIHANVVIVAGILRGDVVAQKVEIRSSGRVWGNVVTASFSTEEGAFLRGQIRMEDKVDIGVGPDTETDSSPAEEPVIHPCLSETSTGGESVQTEFPISIVPSKR